MSGQEEAQKPTDTDAVRIDELVAELGRSARWKARKVATAEERIQRIRDQLAAEVDPANEKDEQHLQELSDLVAKKLASGELDGKTLELRSGSVSVRTTSSIEIIDKAVLRRKALLHRIWTAISVAKPREVQKTLIAKLFRARPEVIKWLKGGAEQVETTRMTVKPHKVTAKIERDLHPLRTTMPESS